MVLFREIQRFRQPWLWAVLLGVAAWSTWVAGRHIMVGERAGTSPTGAGGLLLFWVVSAVLLPGLFAFASLRTEVRETGIHVRFRPFHLRERTFPLDALARAEAVEYNPLLEYGGWGIRLGPRGWAYNVSGRRGVRFTLTNGKTILVGTEKPEAFVDAIQDGRSMQHGS